MPAGEPRGGEPLGGEARAPENTTPEATQLRVADKIARRGLHAVQNRAKRLQKLRVEYVSVQSIRPNTYNPNRQDEQTLELLRRSMREDGFTQPIVVHRESQQIVDGEHRWRAAIDLGMTQVPVVFVDMSAEQMRIATLRHNRARGTEDVELSVEVLRDLQELGAIGWAQDSLMLSDAELNDLLVDVPAPEQLAGEDFSEAWAPERGDAIQEDTVLAGGSPAVLVEKQVPDHAGAINAVAMTHDAAAEMMRRKEVLQAATTERERTRLSQAFEVPFRLQFVFTGEEAELVKSVLGDEPAERLLAICGELAAAAPT